MASVGLRKICIAVRAWWLAFAFLLLASIAVSGVAAAPAAAQKSAQQVVEDLNRDAMEAYNALDINKAGAMLEEALRVAQDGGIVGPQLARTHLNFGVVLIGGVGDQNAGLNAFVAALCADPAAQLDPLTSTPDIQAVFTAAMERARGGACPTGGGPAAGPAGPAAPLPPPPDQALVHYSPPEQLAQTPLPLYVEINPLAQAEKIYLFYKGLGMDKYKRVPMYRFGTGFAYQVSCTDVWEPKVTYYIEAHGEDDKVVGVIGTSAQPIEVPIVAARTQGEPALPGAVPPATCQSKECPPGVKGCKQLGQVPIAGSCSNDQDCQSGLECRSEECMLIGGGGTEVPEYDPSTGGYEEIDEPELDDPKQFKPTFVQLGFVVGMSLVTAGMVADRPPPDDLIFVDETGQFVQDPYASHAAGGNLYFPMPGVHDDKLTAWLPDADSYDDFASGAPLGGNCSGDGVTTGPVDFDGGGELVPSRYCVRVKSAGLVPALAMRAAIGHFITPEIGLSAIFRLAFSAGEGTLANMLLGARGEYMLTPRKARGLMASVFAGGTFGQIQAKPPASGNTDDAPFVRSGLMGVHVGGTLRYRLMPNFGFYMAPEIDVQLPTFLINIDLTLAGLEGAF
jgi:hypothetical protein